MKLKIKGDLIENPYIDDRGIFTINSRNEYKLHHGLVYENNKVVGELISGCKCLNIKITHTTKADIHTCEFCSKVVKEVVGVDIDKFVKFCKSKTALSR